MLRLAWRDIFSHEVEYNYLQISSLALARSYTAILFNIALTHIKHVPWVKLDSEHSMYQPIYTFHSTQSALKFFKALSIFHCFCS